VSNTAESSQYINVLIVSFPLRLPSSQFERLSVHGSQKIAFLKRVESTFCGCRGIGAKLVLAVAWMAAGGICGRE
jgi:hypothetical protein